MKVTALKEQLKDQNRVSIFVDNAYSFSLTLSQVIDQKIKVGMELSESMLAELKKLSLEGKMYAQVLDWLSRRPHSTKEFQQYMYKKKAPPEQTELFLQKLLDKGYLNDEHFAQWWQDKSQFKHKSSRSIRAELSVKGIKSSVNNSGSDIDAIKALISKLQSRPRYADQNKLIRYLIGKGFSYSDIKSVLNDSD